MTGDDQIGFERKKAVVRLAPCGDGGGIVLAEPQEHLVVDQIASEQRLDRGSPQGSGVDVITLYGAEHFELFAFEHDRVAGHRFGRAGMARRIDAENGIPALHLERQRAPDVSHHDRVRHDLGIGECILQHFHREKVIGMVMGDKDGREVLAAVEYHRDNAMGVGAGKRGIDEDRILLALDQRDIGKQRALAGAQGFDGKRFVLRLRGGREQGRGECQNGFPDHHAMPDFPGARI